MNIDQGKLIAALRRRFKQPADAVRALLGEDAEAAMLNSSPAESGKRDFRVALEQMLPELHLPGSAVEKIYALLDQHIPFDRGAAITDRDDRDDEDDDRDGEPIADRRTHVRGRDEEREHDEDGDDREAEVRAFLAKKGMPQDAIDTAVELARDAIRRGVTRRGSDSRMLRRNATGGGVGGMAGDAADSFHSLFPDARRIGGWSEPTTKDLASFNRLFPEAKKIHEGATTARDSESFEKMFPDASRIGVGAR
jgi:hypothetical protein